jgi:hypothetical protein
MGSQVQVQCTVWQCCSVVSLSRALQVKDEANAKLGHQAANMIGTALQGLNYAGANPWASIAGLVMRRKPHKSEDKVGLG